MIIKVIKKLFQMNKEIQRLKNALETRDIELRLHEQALSKFADKCYQQKITIRYLTEFMKKHNANAINQADIEYFKENGIRL